MKKNRSKSVRGGSKKKLKINCNFCESKAILTINIKNALYRKYSSSQKYHYLQVYKKLSGSKLQTEQTNSTELGECLEKYHRPLSRKHIFPQLKQIYKLHRQIPRIFDRKIKNILDKCYHRKRLLEYFKMAKLLGLKVQSIKFSTFLLSLTNCPNQPQREYEPLIGKISTYDFSEEVEKQLLQTMKKTQENINPNLI